MDPDSLDSSTFAGRTSLPLHPLRQGWGGVRTFLATAFSVALAAVAVAENAASVSSKPPTATAKGNATGFPVTWTAPERVAVPMKMRQGLPTVPCTLNGHVIWCILDTGSQECVLEASAARECGVRLVSASQARVEVTGVCGSEFARVGVPESLSIGDWKSKGFPFVVRAADTGTPAAKSQIAFNILGMSALQTMCSYVTFDYARHEAIFGFKQRYRPSAAIAGRTPFLMRHGVPMVKISHAGRDWDALLDTGATSKMEISQENASQLDLTGTSRWFRGARIGLGKSSTPRERRFQTFKLTQVACLGQTWRNVDAIVVENDTKIGSGLCESQRLTVDFTSSQIWLESPVAPRE
jgi:predicted aspartyl protease